MQIESPQEQKKKTFLENAADFTQKHGMKVCASVFLGGNVVLMAQPLWEPEHYDFLRNTSAALFQYAANCHQIKGNRTTAYDYSVVGGASHAAASFSSGLFFGGVMWSLFTEASYKASQWPQRIRTFFGIKPKEKPAEAVTEEKTKKKNWLGNFVENKLDFLKDPHARAGTVALVSNVGQFIEGVATHNSQLMTVGPLWILAAGFYAAHGYLHAKDKNRAAMTDLKTA